MGIDDRQIEQSAALMKAFAERTGLTSSAPATRYLWTDAFAVCNFIGLARATGNEAYQTLARQLIEQVHETLGRHREDDPRTGWLSGPRGEASPEHPTRAGLRIGKPLPERGTDEALDQRLEWDRDGQYFHYLTQWMHALDVAARAMGEAHYVTCARELAETATAAFVYQGPAGQLRMVWKMSIDLSRPLVPSMGHHDPLDGYITIQQLEATMEAMSSLEDDEPNLRDEARIFGRMVQGRDWTTSDPLGLGGLLIDAALLAQLVQHEGSPDQQLLIDLLRSAAAGLRRWSRTGSLSQPARQRLAFRELGLAIGLQGIRRIRENVVFLEQTQAGPALDVLSEALAVGERIVSFWLEPSSRQSPTWTEHEDINAVMLATALAPQGCLILPNGEG